MTTLAELVAATPAAARGQPIQEIGDMTGWRHVIELADPSAGASVAWHDITSPFTGYEYTRGAEEYGGRYRASVVTLDLQTDDDSLAPWNDDTSPTFGVHVELGPGLLLRSGFIRVEGAAVVEWLPRFTCKVEEWGDASYSRGRVRQYRIVARDTLSSLVAVPLPSAPEESWSDRMFRFLTDSGWPYGSAIYGAQYESDTVTPILELAARDAQTSAVTELDVICDPVGLVWYTNRLGQLVVRPRVDDTFHADAFAAGATGDEFPPDTTPVDFTWYACSDPASGAAAYAMDSSIEPFGLDKTERAVINHVKIVGPGGTFDDDDPISIQRYDRKTMQATWIADNDTVAAQILASRSYATVEARPLHVELGLDGFYPGPATLDFLKYIAIQHRNNDAALVAYANGWIRHYREQVYPLGCDVVWQLTITADIYNTSSDVGLLPVEDLALVDVTEMDAEFSWTNPAQTITPTHTQIRLINTASLWATVAYPITGAIWHSLDPATGYEFQVRLVRIVDGLITHTSPTRSITFTTDPATIPTPGGDGTVVFPDPGPCDEIDWELQEADDADGPWSTVDSGTLTDAPWEVDLSGFLFNPAKLYRVESDACGDVTYSNLFVGDCSEPSILGDAPYDDADLEAYWPAICPPDIVVEAITEQYATHGPSYGGFTFDGDGSAVLIAAAEGIMAHGLTPTAVQVVTTDSTIACKAMLMTQPDAPVVLFQCAGMTITAVAEDANWTVSGKVWEEGAGFTTISTSTELDFGAWYDIALVHDVAAGDLFLYVDGNEEASALGTVGYRHNPDYFEIGCADTGLVTNCAMWSRVLDPSELPGFVPLLTVTINRKSGQSDPAIGTPVLFEAVFSEAVSGFAGTDVALSGTAGATVAALSTLDNITFTVAVSGMTTDGTIVASIPAAVCVSVAGSIPNEASTSTDNSIDWNQNFGDHRWDMSAQAFTSPIPDLIGSNNLSWSGTTITATTLNGLTAANFPGSGSNHVMDAGISHTQPLTVVIVAQITSDGGLFDKVGSGAHCSFYGFSGTWSLDAGTALNCGSRNSSTHVFWCEFNGASSKFYLDGTLVASGNGGANNLPSLRVGNNRIPSAPITAKIGEIYTSDSIATSGQRTALTNNLKAKWGIP